MRKEVQDLWLLAEPYVRDAGFDLIDRRSLVFVQELECGSAAVERDDAAGLRAPVCKLAQPESVPVEGERLVELCDGQGDA